MSEITLSNYADLLDPKMVDTGGAFLAAGKLISFTISADNLTWSAAFEEKKQKKRVKIELKGKEVSLIQCDCDAHEPEGWEDDPCVHAMALLYAMKNGVPGKKVKAVATKGKVTGIEKTKKNLEVKVSKRKVSPEEALLDELEKPALKAFLQEVMSKNKEFKSQFMLHFSKNTADATQHYEALITQAVLAIKGRRKYLQPIDAGKIATALAPLFKKAAEAESKGFFAESLAIVQPILEKCTDVYDAVQGDSTRFNNFLANAFDLRTQVIVNPALPFAMKETLLETVKKEYHSVRFSLPPIRNEVYKSLLETSRVFNQLGELALILETELAKLDRSVWSSWGEGPRYYLIQKLMNIYDNELKTPQKTDFVLKSHKDILSIILILIKRKIADNCPEEALSYLNHIEQNSRLYSKQSGTSGVFSSTSELEMTALGMKGDLPAAAKIALTLFAESYFKDFRHYDTAKKYTPDPSAWETQVAQILKKIKSGNSYWVSTGSVYQIFAKEGRYSELLEGMGKENNPLQYLTNDISFILLERSPETYWAIVKRAVDALKDYSTFVRFSHLFSNIIKTASESPEQIEQLKKFEIPLREYTIKSEYPKIWLDRLGW